MQTRVQLRMRDAWLAAAFLSLAALVPQPVTAQSTGRESLPPEQRSYILESDAENACKDWQRPRPCLGAGNEVRYQCVARGPFAKLWSMLRSDERPEDDEVRVKVIRKGPSGMSPNRMVASSGAMSFQDAEAAAEARSRSHRTVVVREGKGHEICRDTGSH